MKRADWYASPWPEIDTKEVVDERGRYWARPLGTVTGGV